MVEDMIEEKTRERLFIGAVAYVITEANLFRGQFKSLAVTMNG